ncbi:MAG: hypothetical protein WBA93_19970 [Microcoleaceae cyanobacterium]
MGNAYKCLYILALFSIAHIMRLFMPTYLSLFGSKLARFLAPEGGAGSLANLSWRSELNKKLGDLINSPVEVGTKFFIFISILSDVFPTGYYGNFSLL